MSEQLSSQAKAWRTRRKQIRQKESVRGKDGFPKYILTLRTLCACYMRCWQEYHIKVSPEMIKHWQSGRRIGTSDNPWHPNYDDRQRYIWAECKAWFQKVILPKYQHNLNRAESQTEQREPEIPIEELEDLETRKEFEHREWERAKERGEFISRASALATGVAAVKKLNLMVRSEDEQQCPIKRREKLSEILNSENISADISAKICEEFMAWDIKLGKEMTDRREALMASVASFKDEEQT